MPLSNTRSGRRWKRLGLILTGLAITGIVGLWVSYRAIGHTPGELMDYSEGRLAGHPSLEALVLPAFKVLREWLDEPSRHTRQKRPFDIPRLPSLILTTSGEPGQQPQDEPTNGHRLRVGPKEPIRTIAEAARLAQDGDIVEIQAGEYHADVATWRQKKLVIRGVGGNARLIADGRSTEDKAIWVISNGNFDVQNIEFIGAHASDRNGAGIRFENGHLRVRNCLFWGNENGILTSGGIEQRNAILEIEGSEFAYNGTGDGLTHNLYVGSIAMLKVSGSYFHHANAGHLIKSRAARNEITYNRLTDESGGRASYELEFPNGGIAYAIGNIIQQTRTTENSTLVSYGAEKYTWPHNRLYLASNTLVNDHPYGGTFLRVAPGVEQVVSANNLLIGKGSYSGPNSIESVNDIHAGWNIFHQAVRYDYHLADSGRKLGYTLPPSNSPDAMNLGPAFEYLHPRQLRALSDSPAYPGALQSRADDNPPSIIK